MGLLLASFLAIGGGRLQWLPLLGFGAVAVCAGGVVAGGVHILSGFKEADTKVRSGARLTAICAALTAGGGVAGLATIMAGIPPTDRGLFGLGFICLIGPPCLLLAGTLLGATITLGLDKSRRAWVTEQERRWRLPGEGEPPQERPKE